MRAALYDIEPAKLQHPLNEIFATDCVIHLASSFEDLDGPAELVERAYLHLIEAIADFGRRVRINSPLFLGDQTQKLSRQRFAGLDQAILDDLDK